jgi:hypothetical protein
MTCRRAPFTTEARRFRANFETMEQASSLVLVRVGGRSPQQNRSRARWIPTIRGHRDAERRREETREWLKQRERELGLAHDAPSVAAEHPGEK